MCDTDRLCQPEPGSTTTQESTDDDDHGYHTPKNIFNAEVSRISQMHLSYIEQQNSPQSDADGEEENPYSTIKKCPLRTSLSKNLESLIQKNALAAEQNPQKSRSVFYKDLSMDNMLRELEHTTLTKKLQLLDRLKEFDHVDIALFISFVLLIIFGFFGFFILLNEF
ncbi:unnamed protein product [Cylicocyclus nassatus]|uniref:Uncharacterized protein n=1 Tax=Cylicocyclus nassatus TaxID=53992 RepID=A0AA36M808_CYLNA|nr:unnamed protein product [Cylicocyclus nassatus]